MRLILDAGALVAIERGDRETVALVKRELVAGRVPLTHGGVILTSDPRDLRRLAAAVAVHVDLVAL